MRSGAVRCAIFVVLLAVIALTSTIAFADVPGVLPFQAVIRDDSGNIIPENTQITFAIYDAATGGTRLWGTEAHTVTPVNGVVSILLGTTTPIDASVFEGGEGYLSLTISGEELSRIRMGTTGFAFQAGDAEKLGGVAASSYASSTHEHALGELSDVTLGTPQEGQVLTYSGGTWLPQTGGGGGEDNDWTISGSNMYTHTSITGNVGVGTTSPQSKLHVAGDVRATGDIYEGGLLLNTLYVPQGAEGGVTAGMIATDAVGSDEIAPNAVGSEEIDTDAVGNTELANVIDIPQLTSTTMVIDNMAQDAEGSALTAYSDGGAADATVDVYNLGSDHGGVGEIVSGSSMQRWYTPHSGLCATGGQYGIFGAATAEAPVGLEWAAGGYFVEDGDPTTFDDDLQVYVALRFQGVGQEQDYKIIGGGTVASIMETEVDGAVTLIAPESPEALIQDFGSAQMVDGSAVVELDPTFLEVVTISDEHPMRVYIQFTSPPPTQYYVSKSLASFEVIDSSGEGSNASFDFFVVATWKGWEGVRFPAAPKPPVTGGGLGSAPIDPAVLDR